MPKEKEKVPRGKFRRIREIPEDYPSKAARDTLTMVVIRFIEATPLLELKERYIRLGEAGMLRFQENMERLMREALMDDEWQQDRSKPTFEGWLKDATRDATWNLRVEVGRLKKRGAAEDDNLFKQVDYWASMSKSISKQKRKGQGRKGKNERKKERARIQRSQPISALEDLDNAEGLEGQASGKGELVGGEGDVGEAGGCRPYRSLHGDQGRSR